MNEERYQELLGRLLDDELDAAQVGELAEWLRANPGAQSDVRRNLFLWELYSQQRRPERSADAFAEACKTRILAEADEHAFVEGVEARLREAGAASATADSVSSSFAEKLRRLLFSLRWVMSGGVAVSIVAACIWLFPAINNVPSLAIGTGSQVTLERAGQSLPAQDGLKLLPGDLLRIAGSDGASIDYGTENTRIALRDSAEVKTLSWQKGKRFELRQGKIEASVARQRPVQPMVVTTPQAEARVLGTKFTLIATTNATRLDVSEGKVRLTSTADGARVDVPKGHYATAAPGVELAALPKPGHLLREYWTNLPGKDISDLLDHPDYPDRPNGRDYVDLLEVPAVGSTNYGCRLVGYLHPPVTGQYTFWIAASPAAAVNLSPNENPADAFRIFGNHFDFGRGRESQPREWDRKASSSRTQSQPIPLVAGRRYYIEAMHKADDRVGHLAIAWTIPGGERKIIAGQYLSPLKLELESKKP